MLEDNETECGYIEHDERYANHRQYFLFVLFFLVYSKWLGSTSSFDLWSSSSTMSNQHRHVDWRPSHVRPAHSEPIVSLSKREATASCVWNDGMSWLVIRNIEYRHIPQYPKTMLKREVVVLRQTRSLSRPIVLMSIRYWRVNTSNWHSKTSISICVVTPKVTWGKVTAVLSRILCW